MKILHIGASDAIGRQMLSCPFVDVVSHRNIHHVDFSQYNTISISAFDPKRKTHHIPRLTVIDHIINLINNPTHQIIYYSTCRTLESVTSVEHATYVRGKLEDESKLRENFAHVSVVYLPVIVPSNPEDNSRFFSVLFNNLMKNRVHFNLTRDSKSNFVLADELLALVDNIPDLTTKQTLMSRTSCSIGSLVDFLVGGRDEVDISYGKKYEIYPSSVTENRIYTKVDTGSDLSWLTALKGKYADDI